MCWNWGVSIGFAIGLFAGSLWIAMRRKLGWLGFDRDRYEALIIVNLAFVQFWEFLIWLHVYPENGDLDLCPKANSAFTAMVYFHGVVFWPPIVNTFGIKTTKGIQEYFLFPLVYGCLYTLLGIFDLFYSQFALNRENICGLDGQVFLKWHLALSEIRILPNGFDWFLFTAFPFIFYKPRPVGLFMMFYLILTFAIPYLVVSLGEAASVFCWLGTGLFIFFMVEPYLHLFFCKYYPNLIEYDVPVLKQIDIYFMKKREMSSRILRSPVVSQSEIELREVVTGSTTSLP